MFCKWCGAPNVPDAKCCSACGKKFPPLDDCGGFPGLVPEDRRKKREEPPEEQPEPQQEPEEEPEEPEPAGLAEAMGSLLQQLLKFSGILDPYVDVPRPCSAQLPCGRAMIYLSWR